jgi:hypothetical protein
MIECPQCKTVYCAECFGELPSGKCSQCGSLLHGTPAFAYFDEQAEVSLRTGQKLKQACLVHVENYGIRIDKKWYLAHALPPEDCMIEWKELRNEEKEAQTDNSIQTEI